MIKILQLIILITFLTSCGQDEIKIPNDFNKNKKDLKDLPPSTDLTDCTNPKKAITFHWIPNHPSDNVIEYRVFVGESPGEYDYSSIMGLPEVNNERMRYTLISMFDLSKTYYFAAKAFNIDGESSPYTDDVIVRFECDLQEGLQTFMSGSW